ncbi:MAG: hypothetical protein P857_929 [Candidatus Xenolissoclinum pacificiensis L6]|uniref:NusB/RsmB/TIM44 domain-containing protein n=1 Tax=Candidatus Xenolissoclinum pacificiensis L6 TaxID=1401685 RepID=W2V0Z3_9RICK|nr:MAG: hypothetical protein P857_929 [Candidatus Xenolissoclinum pacificiensis L6]
MDRNTRILAIQVIYNVLYNRKFDIEIDYHDIFQSIIENGQGVFLDEDDGKFGDVDLERLHVLLSNFMGNIDYIKRIISSNLVGWDVERLDILKLSIIYVSALERVLKDHKVNKLISEYIKISKYFFPVEKDTAFFNAILDKVLNTL